MKLSINSWSFEKALGPLRLIEWNDGAGDNETKMEAQPAVSTLRAWTEKLGSLSYRAMELAYAHLRDISEERLTEFRQTAATANVEPGSLLLDFGDLSTDDPRRAEADGRLYREWIDIAARAGFVRVRIGAGDARPTDAAALDRAADRLIGLAEYGGRAGGVRIVTENLGPLLSTANNCLRLLERAGGSVGFTADFGNFPTDKYAQLALVLPHAETVHAKAETPDGDRIDADDYRRCLALCREAGFDGILSLTYLGAGDPWERLAEMRELAAEPAVSI